MNAQETAHVAVAFASLAVSAIACQARGDRARALFWFCLGLALVAFGQAPVVRFLGEGFDLGVSLVWAIYPLLALFARARFRCDYHPTPGYGSPQYCQMLDVVFACFLVTVLVSGFSSGAYEETSQRLVSWFLIYFIGVKVIGPELAVLEHQPQSHGSALWFWRGAVIPWLFLFVVFLIAQGSSAFETRPGLNSVNLFGTQIHRLEVLGNANRMGMLIGLAAIVLVDTALRVENPMARRFTVLGVFALSGGVSLLIHSRGALLAMTAAGLVLLWVRKIFRGSFLMVFGILFLAIVWAYHERFYALLFQYLKRPEESANTFGDILYQARWIYWQDAIATVVDRGLTLAGAGCGVAGSLGHPIDNGYITTFAETGIIGLVTSSMLYLYCLLSGFRLAGRATKETANLAVGVFVCVFLFVANVTFEALSVASWTSFLFFVAAGSFVRRRRWREIVREGLPDLSRLEAQNPPTDSAPGWEIA